MKKLYKCDNCIALYENKARAKRCHYGDVVIYEVTMIRVKDYQNRGNNPEKVLRG